MSLQSKEEDTKLDGEVVRENVKEAETKAASEISAEEESNDDGVGAANGDAGTKSKKKKSKKARLKKALGVGDTDASASGSGSSSNPASKLTSGMVDQLLEMNPSLKGEVAGMTKEQRSDALKKLDVADLLTGMSVTGKNRQDMASYKFWQTQPVPRFDEPPKAEEGPIKIIDPEKVRKEPKPMHEGFEWVTMDLTNDKQIEEVYQLLSGHYVEDPEAAFRLTYSASFLNWALKSPGWREEWHIGVRATKSQKLVAFISGVPVSLRVRTKTLKATEINFMCVHKKLRSKRLAPELIAEITRRCYLVEVYQAIYTAGIVLPKPISSCRYMHRPLDWMKLYDSGFSGLPPKSSPARQVAKHRLPTATSTQGLRPMEKKDVRAVQKLLSRYLKRFDMAPEYAEEEVEHWLLHNESMAPQQVIWTYVVEDSQTKKITDFFSFYCLESAVIRVGKHSHIRAAYLFYYASEAAFEKDESALKTRLNSLINDALILAKSFNFDVFNALTLLDNPLFLESQKFGIGDGQLHFYLYNYNALPIAGGVDAKNNVDESRRGGVGLVML